MKSLKLYTPFTKSEKQPDGSVIVYGTLTDETEDLDGDVVEYEGSKEAVASWPGNVREMHQPSAVGVAVDIVPDDEKREIRLAAKIVDSEAVRKVETGVYKGFSMGGDQVVRRQEKPKNVQKYRMIEASLVDAPANPSSMFTMYKMADTDVSSDPGDETDTPAPETETEPSVPNASISVEAFQAVMSELTQLVAVLKPEAAKKVAGAEEVGEPLKKLSAATEGETLEKRLSDISETLRKVNDTQESFTKRLDTIEGALKPGGPALTAEALMKIAGAVAADKTLLGSGGAVSAVDEEAVLKKLVDDERDPMMKQKYGEKLAKLQIMKIQTGQAVSG